MKTRGSWTFFLLYVSVVQPRWNFWKRGKKNFWPGSKINFSKKVSKHTHLGSLIILYRYGTTRFVRFGVLLDTKFRLFTYPHFEGTFGQENSHTGHRTPRHELRLAYMCSWTIFRGGSSKVKTPHPMGLLGDMRFNRYNSVIFFEFFANFRVPTWPAYSELELGSTAVNLH